MNWYDDIVQEYELRDCLTCDTPTPREELIDGVCQDCQCPECGSGLLQDITSDAVKCRDCGAVSIFVQKKMKFQIAIDSLGEIIL